MIPNFVLLRQTNPAPPAIEHAGQAVEESIRALNLDPKMFAGKRIGITVGSRGIDRIPELARAVVKAVKDAGGKPEIFAAMGSHGGGTKEGQREMLRSLGVTEETVGAPVLCCAETECYGRSELGYDIYGNTLAKEFDGIVLLNRVKTHTDFSDETESGLLKMMAIGIGNPTGCAHVHNRALVYGYGKVIRDAAKLLMSKLPILLGIMVTENWQGKLDHVEAVLPENFYEREKALLAAYKEHQVKLPVKKLDVLLVEEIGKNISGAGMDTKVIGRVRIKNQPEPPYPDIGRIVVLSVTEHSHGNAIGIGLADLTTQRVLDKIDLQATSLNAVSSMSVEQGSLPCIVKDDKMAVLASLSTLGKSEEEYQDATMAYIVNTGKLVVMAVSEALYRQIQDSPYIEKLAGPFPLEFNEAGELKKLSQMFPAYF